MVTFSTLPVYASPQLQAYCSWILDLSVILNYSVVDVLVGAVLGFVSFPFIMIFVVWCSQYNNINQPNDNNSGPKNPPEEGVNWVACFIAFCFLIFTPLLCTFHKWKSFFYKK